MSCPVVHTHPSIIYTVYTHKLLLPCALFCGAFWLPSALLGSSDSIAPGKDSNCDSHLYAHYIQYMSMRCRAYDYIRRTDGPLVFVKPHPRASSGSADCCSLPFSALADTPETQTHAYHHHALAHTLEQCIYAEEFVVKALEWRACRNLSGLALFCITTVVSTCNILVHSPYLYDFDILFDFDGLVI